MKAKIIPIYRDKYIVKLKKHWWSRWKPIRDHFYVEMSDGTSHETSCTVYFTKLEDAHRAIEHLMQFEKVVCPKDIKRALTELVSKLDKEIKNYKDADSCSYEFGYWLGNSNAKYEIEELIKQLK